jgi:hypothetical protein
MRRARVAMGLALVVLCGIGSLAYGQAGTAINAQDYLNVAKIQAEIKSGKDSCELARRLATADPKHASIFTGALVTLAPTQAVCITTAAVKAAPSRAADITAAAVRAAPTQAASIRAAVAEVVRVMPPPPGLTVAEVIKEVDDAIEAVLKEISMLAIQAAANANDIKGVSKE